METNKLQTREEPFYKTRNFYVSSGMILGAAGGYLFGDYVINQNLENICQLTESAKNVCSLVSASFGGFAGSIFGYGLDSLFNNHLDEEVEECP